MVPDKVHVLDNLDLQEVARPLNNGFSGRIRCNGRVHVFGRRLALPDGKLVATLENSSIWGKVLVVGNDSGGVAIAHEPANASVREDDFVANKMILVAREGIVNAKRLVDKGVHVVVVVVRMAPKIILETARAVHKEIFVCLVIGTAVVIVDALLRIVIIYQKVSCDFPPKRARSYKLFNNAQNLYTEQCAASCKHRGR